MDKEISGYNLFTAKNSRLHLVLIVETLMIHYPFVVSEIIETILAISYLFWNQNNKIKMK